MLKKPGIVRGDIMIDESGNDRVIKTNIILIILHCVNRLGGNGNII